MTTGGTLSNRFHLRAVIPDASRSKLDCTHPLNANELVRFGVAFRISAFGGIRAEADSRVLANPVIQHAIWGRPQSPKPGH
jgi:hypothetical protein